LTTGRQRQQEPSRKNDQWTENIHLKKYHEESQTAANLAANNLLTSKDDKFIDFVLHIDNQKRTTVNNQIQEILLINQSGPAQRESDHYKIISRNVEDYESELE